MGGERHYESKVSGPRTQRSAPGQDSNPDSSIRSLAHWIVGHRASPKSRWWYMFFFIVYAPSQSESMKEATEALGSYFVSNRIMSKCYTNDYREKPNRNRTPFRKGILTLSLSFLSGVYADGPGAYLFHGVVEQQYVFHVMDHALCLSSSKQKSCDKHVKRREAVKNTAYLISALSMYSLLVSAAFCMAAYTQCWLQDN